MPSLDPVCPVLALALWPVTDGQPHPDAADPWGESHAADCLTDYHDRDLGPYLTVTASTPGAVGRPGETCRLVFAGDATGALLSYAARVAEDTGHPPFEGEAVEQARQAFGVAVEWAADECAREACLDWMCPDPDTLRPLRRMPERTRSHIAESAHARATEEEAAALDAHLCAALGVDAAGTVQPAPLRLAA